VTLAGNSTYSGTNDLTFTGATALTGTRTLTVSNSNTTFSGVISGAYGVTKSGAGTLIFGGASANTFTGALAVSDGMLVLNKTAGVNTFAGSTFTIGDAVGAAGSAIAQYHAANQLPNGTAITIRSDGQLDLQSYTDSVGALTMTGGSVS